MRAYSATRKVFLLPLLLPAAITSSAHAGAMHSMQALADGANWANSFGNSMWVEAVKGGTTYHGSGVALDPWNVLVSGHQIYETADGFASSVLVGLGSNYISDRGTTFTAADYVIHPGWDGTLFSQRIDLAMLHFPSGIPGMSSLDIFGTSLGQQLNGAGHGQPAAGESWLSVDGQERAYNWYVDAYGSSGGTVSTNYIRSFLHPMFIRNDPMAGGITPGDSGMGVFDPSGNLVALGVGAGSSMPLYGYSSYALQLELFEGWIDQNRIVPEPGTLSLLIIGGIALLRRQR